MLLKLLSKGLRLEWETDAGRLNALLIVLCTIFLMVAGVPNAIEQLIALWADQYTSAFPVISALAVLMGGGLVCVLLLVILQPFLPKQRRRRSRKKC